MNPISKGQLCWILVRLIGMFFFYQTVVGVFQFFAAFSQTGSILPT